MAAKLASLSDNTIYASDRYFNLLTHRDSKESCGCGNSGESKGLWNQIDLTDNKKFDFNTSWVLESKWCPEHGAEYCVFLS